MRSFCSAKAPHIFSAKNISTLDFRRTRRLNESLTNDFVKLTMLWTTGPRVSIDIINYPSSKQRKCRSDCVDVQADLHFWCWCIALTGFLMTWLKWAMTWQNQQNECASSETQISLGISPVWSVFTVRMNKPWVLSYPLSAQRRLWSVWADAQADLSHSEDSIVKPSC